MVDCCGYRFCKTCIQPLVPNKKCPLCNCQFTSVIQDKLLLRTLNQKKVYCTHKTGGCEWIGELALLDKHLNAQPDVDKRMEGCAIQKIKCSYCSNQLERNKVEEHEFKCPERTITCEYCNIYRSTYSYVVLHWKICGGVPVNCPNDGCEATVKRSNIIKHVQEQCPHTMVPCEYAYAGCQVRVVRKSMSEHLESAAKDHVDIFVRHCAEQKQSLENLQLELQDVKLEAVDIKAKNEPMEENSNHLKELLDLRCEDNHSDYEVLVTNLSFDTKEDMIKSLFGQHGRIDRIEFYPSSNMAVVEYEDESSIDKLFEYQKSLAKGLRLRGSKLNCIRLSYY